MGNNMKQQRIILSAQEEIIDSFIDCSEAAD